MAKKRTARSAEFKAKVAIAALQEQKSVQQLARLYGVHPSQVQQWKKQLQESAATVFHTGDRSQEAAVWQAREAELFEQIGRLNMELDWVKKKVAGGS